MAGVRISWVMGAVCGCQRPQRWRHDVCLRRPLPRVPKTIYTTRKNLMKHFLYVATACALIGCGKPPPPAPESVIKANHFYNFVLSNGERLPVEDQYCKGPMRKTKDGFYYMECISKLRGFVHYDSNFCTSRPNEKCSTSRPDE